MCQLHPTLVLDLSPSGSLHPLMPWLYTCCWPTPSHHASSWTFSHPHVSWLQSSRRHLSLTFCLLLGFTKYQIRYLILKKDEKKKWSLSLVHYYLLQWQECCRDEWIHTLILFFCYRSPGFDLHMDKDLCIALEREMVLIIVSLWETLTLKIYTLEKKCY